MGVIIALLGINIWSAVPTSPPTPPTPSPLQEVCQKKPEALGLKQDLCAKIVSGRMYEECVNTLPDVSQYIKFMT
jgi:hypothetical protein